MLRFNTSVVAAAVLAAGFIASSAAAFAGTTLFDVEARRAALQTPAMKSVRANCLAVDRKPEWVSLEPVLALSPTEGYGTDRAANDVSIATMVLSGRALAGDQKSETDLVAILSKWSAAGAFLGSKEDHDPYYAMKRVLLPLIVGFEVVEAKMPDADKARTKAWLDTLVRKIDKTFDGDVDFNNHRYLADSVLTLWGSYIGDAELIEKGHGRLLTALADMRADGSLPLETRRGSRALWYSRQSLSSFTLISELASRRGEDFYRLSKDGKSLDLMLGFFLNGLVSPSIVNGYSAQNYIPGPDADYRSMDLGFLSSRGNGRNYMAWSEAILARFGSDTANSLAHRRLAQLIAKGAGNERPLIDEFIGGNATCFWKTP